MKLTNALLSSLIGLSFIGAAHAESPSWNYVEAGYAQVDIDNGIIDDDFDGFTLGGSFSFLDDFFIQGQYTDVSDDVANLELDFDWSTVALGYKYGLNDTTDLYGAVSFERVGVELQGAGDQTENGYGLTTGVRSMVHEQVELFAEVGYVDIDDADIDGASFKVGGQYFINDMFSVGADYRTVDDIDMFKVTARYHF